MCAKHEVAHRVVVVAHSLLMPGESDNVGIFQFSSQYLCWYNPKTLAVSKMLAASHSLPNLTIIGAQSQPKKANKSSFNTGFSAGNKQKTVVFFVLLSPYVYRSPPNCMQIEDVSTIFATDNYFWIRCLVFALGAKNTFLFFFVPKFFFCDKSAIYEPNLTNIKIQM